MTVAGKETPANSVPAAAVIRRGLALFGIRLLGYLILFATHAFAPQCQYRTRKLPSPLVFFTISTHSTATL